MSILDIRNLTKSYGSFRALNDISFSIEKGDIFGFLGPNGAGKSTTIKILMDFLHHDAGTVTLFEVDAHENSRELKRRIGYVSAEPLLYANWTGDEHIKLVSRLRNNKVKIEAERLKKLLGLDGKKRVSELSTGNQQKLAIILALSTNPQFLILDEPTRGLDPLLRSSFHDLLKQYRKDGGTILLSSHDLSEVEELCDKVIIIHEGKIIQDTTVKKLRANHKHKVNVSFETSCPDLSLFKELHDLTVTEHDAAFTFTGNADRVLKFLAEYPVKDIEITSTSLEDVFKEIYQ